VYWPNINAAIQGIRAQCKTCNTIAPSQAAEPYLQSPTPEYPFQQVVADFFNLAGHNYLVYADRYTGWNTIFKTPIGDADSSSVTRHLRVLFSTFGVPQELATDGGPPFNSYDLKTFLATWGVHHRISSAYYPQSNGRAELAVKTSKRILRDNTSAGGDIDNDKVARALLQQRNTPVNEIGLSPAQMLYGRQLRDCLPTPAEACKIRPEWRIIAENRERALAKRNILSIEKYNEHTKTLPELQVGDHVAVQNQTGPRPNKWEKTGLVVEKCDNRQYLVKLDGSGRCTLRNRRFLKKIEPVCADRPLTKPRLISGSDNAPKHMINNEEMLENEMTNQQNTHQYNYPQDCAQDVPHMTQQECPDSPVHIAKKLVTDDEMPELRRSARQPKPRRELSMTWKGKSYDYVET
jgi:hypothetical protein